MPIIEFRTVFREPIELNEQELGGTVKKSDVFICAGLKVPACGIRKMG